jgi:hypothetical protein
MHGNIPSREGNGAMNEGFPSFSDVPRANQDPTDLANARWQGVGRLDTNTVEAAYGH